MLNGAHPDQAADTASDTLTTEQANRLIDTLWAIMTAFVEIGFSLSPAQVVQSCGQSTKAGAPDGMDAVKLSYTSQTNSKSNIAPGAGKEQA